MEERLVLTEWERKELTSAQIADVRAIVERLTTELRPRLELATFSGNAVTAQNIIGTVRMPSGAILEVEPKIPAQGSWAEAVVQLIDRHTRIAVTGAQRSKESPRRDDLSTAVAHEFARRLEHALRHEGPIQIYERHKLISSRLNGQLDLSSWVRSRILNPTKFPIQKDEFSVANDFTRALSKVSGILRRSALNGQFESKLRVLETTVIPGQPIPAFVSASVANRNLPSQWAKYRPAWDIAAAVLRNRSVIGDPGRVVGLELAVEPWPLLETLLRRCLESFVNSKPGTVYEVVPRKRWKLLSSDGAIRQRVEPDGLLLKNGAPLATFEAKYTQGTDVPARDHTFQALSTAAALHAPLAIIIYPDDEPIPRLFDVEGFRGTPRKLATVGLGLFSYSRKGGDELRAGIIEDMLQKSFSA